MKTMRVLAVILVLFVVSCGARKMPDPLPAGTETYSIPITPERIDNIVDSSVEPSTPEEKQADIVIWVPPSNTVTPVVVKKKKQSPLKSLFERTMTNKPQYEVKSTNKDVTAEQPKKSIWRRWVLLVVGSLFFLAMIGMAVAWRVANLSPAGILKRLLKR